MKIDEIRIITISREFGAGGSELAAELGRRLAWKVLDQDIVKRVAARLKVNDGIVERCDEHTPPLIARIATVLIVPHPDMYTFPDAADAPSHDAIARATRAVIEEEASSPPIVIVGHGSQCIFAGRRDTLSIRVVAPVGPRMARVMTRLHVDRAAAARLLERADHDRQAYVQRYFQRDWRDEQLYDLQFNTGSLAIRECAAAVVDVVHARASRALPTPVEGGV